MKKKLLFFMGIGITQQNIYTSNYAKPDTNVEEDRTTSRNYQRSRNLKIITTVLIFINMVLVLVNLIWQRTGIIDNPDCMYNPVGMPVNCCRDDIRGGGLCPSFFDLMNLTIIGIIPNQQFLLGLFVEFIMGILSVLAIFIPSNPFTTLQLWVQQGLMALFTIILGILVIIGESNRSESVISNLSANNSQDSLGLIIGIMWELIGLSIISNIYLNRNTSSVAVN